MFPNPIWKYVEASPHQYPAGVQEFSSILKLSTRDRIRFHRKRPPSEWLSDNLPANAGDTGLIPGSGWSTGEGDGCLFQYPGKFHGQRSLASHSPWDCKESDKTEYTYTPTCTHTHTHKPTRSPSSSDISHRSRLLPLLLAVNQRFPQPSFWVQLIC